jgi:hypothetical protein
MKASIDFIITLCALVVLSVFTACDEKAKPLENQAETPQLVDHANKKDSSDVVVVNDSSDNSSDSTSQETTMEKEQNTMRLDEYIVSSNQLDTIIDIVLSDVEDEDCISVSAKKENNIYTIYISAYLSDFLEINSNILGYTPKGDKTIFFRSSIKDLVTKKTGGHKKTFSCIPPPTKDNPLLILGTDGVKEWVFSIDVDNGEILLLRKNLEW